MYKAGDWLRLKAMPEYLTYIIAVWPEKKMYRTMRYREGNEIGKSFLLFDEAEEHYEPASV